MAMLSNPGFLNSIGQYRMSLFKSFSYHEWMPFSNLAEGHIKTKYIEKCLRGNRIQAYSADDVCILLQNTRHRLGFLGISWSFVKIIFLIENIYFSILRSFLDWLITYLS